MTSHALGLRPRIERRAQLAGWLGIALGVSQLTVPDGVARLIGIRSSSGTRWVLRALGVREVMSGLAVLSSSRSAAPVWARVAGDALDLALLGAMLGAGAKRPGRLVAATASVAGVTALDVYAVAGLSRNPTLQKLVQPVHVVRSITINRPPEAVYDFWRKLENLPKFMAHLESVEQQGQTSLWRAKAPAGASISWQAEITLDVPNETLGWRSLAGAAVPSRGAVRFRPAFAGRATELTVELKYEPPLGALGAAFAKLFGEEPGQQIGGDLRRLKQVLETGSVVHSDASIHRGLHPAQPAARDEKLTLTGDEV